ncbi:hydroxyacylglutathione hydrolase [Marinomonas sp. C2222]|uniref:Hydroxyacylglutathione hydrolase n=1 Tax=Marinomonas sargassi TaxID=2984494 RepID=A0ABT2YQN9_9GAMM|nr:hydroxyacylglutathione hydrolase [Marinomonas sargassi]MCV2402208.1 hydroxyacylglutathione hydrolase [Marinomonas sargassi]
MIIYPLRAFQDNYIWIIEDKDSSEIWAIDPGSAAVVEEHCDTHAKTLVGILITHHHKDHTGGIAVLREAAKCPVYGPKHLSHLVTHPVKEGSEVTIFSEIYEVFETPGHTLDHLCFFSKQTTPILFCGDTLFRGGCGRLMEGTAEQMLLAMNKIAALPDNTLVYGTHEYTLANYRFALSLEPNNPDLIESNTSCQQLRNRNKATLPSNLALEKKTNPFLRTHNIELKSNAAQQLNEPPAVNPIDSFAQVRRAKDTFS